LAQKPNVVEAPRASVPFHASGFAVICVPDCTVAALHADVIADWFKLMIACQPVLVVDPVLVIVTLAQ
jgi:hypothetical protein